MFRPSIALFFLLTFLVQLFSSQCIRLEYLLNTASFAKNCENKARPTLHCNGKCQMMKKLKEQEKREQQLPERKQEQKLELFSFVEGFIGLDCLEGKLPAFSFYHTEGSLLHISYPFFRPPQV